jgi:hypothetical protein
MEKDLGNYQSNMLARELAATGYNLTKLKLAQDTSPWLIGSNYSIQQTDFSGGSFSSIVNVVGATGNLVDINVTGRQPYIARNGVMKDTTYTITARIERSLISTGFDMLGNPTENGIPQVFEYAILSDEEIEIKGHVQTLSLLDTVNADIHTNDVLKTNGNAFLVEGYGTYVNGISSSQTDNFRPNVDINGSAPNVYQVDPVEIPPISFDDLRSRATLHHTSGNLTLDGDNFSYSSFMEWADSLGAPSGTGTKDHPFILVVEGDLDLINNIELGGYGILASTGVVDVNPQGSGNGIIGGLFAGQTTMAILAETGIDIESNGKIVAMMFSSGYIEFNGTPDVTGSIAAQHATFGAAGTPLFLFARGSRSIIAPGFLPNGVMGLKQLSYSEW